MIHQKAIIGITVIGLKIYRKIVSIFESVLFKIVFLTIFIYALKIAFALLVFLFFSGFAVFHDIFELFKSGTKDFLLSDPETRAFLWEILKKYTGGELMSFFELFKHNFLIMVGLLIVAIVLNAGFDKLIKALEKQEKRVEPEQPKLVGIPFQKEEYRYDANNQMYLAAGILTEAIYGDSYYVGFYTDRETPYFIHVHDAKAYNLDYLPPDLKQSLVDFVERVKPLAQNTKPVLIKSNNI
ncbi:MAG: hypothetical protein BSOLF_0524 [Candidatus Carbobacillus altaicus]|uniref:Uncharacterized protein n=1 Tax=Candidatus Carbonibacillus altaicus TaxID=2163959 RepID=A0A2R6Y0P7_9BACL|nr:MAG: hypothetical protein BSOLF_0524 [Candidatus Carbobacillus altaicus]